MSIQRTVPVLCPGVVVGQMFDFPGLSDIPAGTTRMVFAVGRTTVLDSNNQMMPQEHARKAAVLRAKASQAGVSGHMDPHGAAAHLSATLLKAASTRRRRRATASTGSTPAPRQATRPIPPVDPMFTRFVVSVSVCPQTHGRVDPPNFYPTVKPLVDGLTDAGWWPDDDYSHLVLMSFKYGGPCPIKKCVGIVLDMTPCGDDSDRGMCHA